MSTVALLSGLLRFSKQTPSTHHKYLPPVWSNAITVIRRPSCTNVNKPPFKFNTQSVDPMNKESPHFTILRGLNILPSLREHMLFSALRLIPLLLIYMLLFYVGSILTNKCMQLLELSTCKLEDVFLHALLLSFNIL